MKKIILSVFCAGIIFPAFCQTVQTKETYVKFSVGHVSFGSGDFSGYSVSIEAAQNTLKKSSWGLHKLLVGGEFIFENGVNNPVIYNSTLQDFFQSFQHVSSNIFWPKAAYYPLKEIVKGFNIQLGPTFGYSYRSTETQARLKTDLLGNSVRESVLKFDNGFTFGYRVSTGIEFDINKQFQAGFRIDFSNNKQAEINTLAGIKLGVKI